MTDALETTKSSLELGESLDLLLEEVLQEQERLLNQQLQAQVLLSPQEKKLKLEQARLKLQHALEGFAKDHDWLRGFELIVEFCHRQASGLLAHQWEGAFHSFKKAIDEQIETQGTLQATMGLSDEAMNAAYEAAIEQYRSQSCLGACHILSAINFLNPGYFDSWLLQGICQFEQGKFEPALASLSMATLIEPAQVLPYMYSAYCYHQMDQAQLAGDFYKLANELPWPEEISKEPMEILKEHIQGQKKISTTREPR